jgi:D-arabinan exo alpha-(1,3)/(1,5)-arabinofuranosidase (non-reducing end)
MDDISSVGFWYQTEPHTQFPRLPDKDHLSIN